MNTNGNQSLRKLAGTSLMISLGLLTLHMYTSCYWLFDHWRFTWRLTDRLLLQISKGGWLDGVKLRLAILAFLAISMVRTSTQTGSLPSLKNTLLLLAGGLALFWGSPLLLVRQGDPELTCLGYIVILTIGYCLVLLAFSRVRRLLQHHLAIKPSFGQEKEGFPQETRKLNGEFSLHLPSRYTWRGQTADSWVNFINPRRGILVVGSPGSGKSRFIIEPLIRQLVQQRHALFVYDFKYPALTRQTYGYFLACRVRYPATSGFYSIQFSDLSRSHRCNVLDPSTLQWVSDALGAARTILLSMNKTWIQQQGEFFVESPINFLAAIIWYLRNYQKGCYCTLPHAIELAQLPYEQLFPLLTADPEIQTLIQPFAQAWNNKTFEMLDGQIASARIPLGRLASPDVYYILSGNDLSLQINDWGAPNILCLGGDPPRQEALAPVLSLYIDRLNQLCNRSERHPCAIVCDEFGTVRAHSLATTIGTARANNITPIIAVQDLAQLRTQYTKHEGDLFLNITGNLLCGQVSGETAQWISERFPRIQREHESISANDSGTSVTTTLQWEPTATQSTIAGLSSGEFLGVLADDPDKKLALKFFHGQLVREDQGIDPRLPLPIIRSIDATTVKENFERIRNDITTLVAEELDKLKR